MKQRNYELEEQKRIQEIDKKIAHYAWTIFVSMLTAIVTTLLLCKMSQLM